MTKPEDLDPSKNVELAGVLRMADARTGYQERLRDSRREMKQLSQAVQAGGTPATPREKPLVKPNDAAKAERLFIRQFQDDWGRINTNFIDITPMGAVAQANGMAGGHTRSYALQNAYNTAINYFAQASGNEYLGAYIVAMGLSDEQQRQATLSALMGIIEGGTLADAPTAGQKVDTSYAGLEASAAGGTLAPGGPNPEEQAALSAQEFARVVADPSQFRSLAYGQQQQFIAEAQKVVDEYKGRGTQGQSIQRAMAAIATGNLEHVLNDAEVEELQARVRQRKDAIEEHGAEVSRTITLDAEFAKAHPAKAAAEAWYLQQQFPDATIRFGEGGVAEAIFDAIGKPIDVIAAIPSAAIATGVHGVRRAFDNASEEDIREQRDRLQEQLRHAPYAQREEILRAIDHANDRLGIASGETEYGFTDYMSRSINSDVANVGFARNIVESTGLLPGDSGYDIALGTTMIAGGFAFDPLTYVAGAAQGVRAARTIPKVEGAGTPAHSIRGLIGRFVYNRMAVTPEVFLERSGAAENIVAATRGMADDVLTNVLQRAIPDVAQRNYLRAAIKTGDKDTVNNTLHVLMSGPAEGQDFVRLSNRAENLAARLNEYDALNAQRNLARGSRGDLARLEERIANMADEGQMAGPEWDALNAEYDELRRAVEPPGYTAIDDAISARVNPAESGPSRTFLEDGTYTEEWLAAKDAGRVEYYGNGVWGGESAGGRGAREYFYVENNRVVARRFVDEAGHVTAQTLPEFEGQGLARRLLDAHWDDLEVRTADDILDLVSRQEFSPGGAYLNRSAARDRLNGLAGRGTRYDELASTRAHDAEELAFVRSVLRGKTDEVAPIDFGHIKALQKSASSWGRSLAKLDEGLESFPGIAEVPESLIPEARELFKGLRRAFNPSGLEGAEALAGWRSRAVFLPGMEVAGALTDVYERSRNALLSVGRLLRVDERTLGRFMADWDNLALLDDPHASYTWLKNYWENILEASPSLGPDGKAALSRLWSSSFDQWGSDVIRVNPPGGVVQTEPLQYRLMQDANGDVLKKGMPVFSADMLSQGVMLPDLTEVLKILHPRAMKSLGAGGLNKATNLWKRIVLTQKLPGALPLRITGELLVARMAAYDLAALSPFGIVDWAKSLFGKGKFARFADDDAFALGSMIRDYEKEGRIYNQMLGAGVLKSGDGEPYYRAMSGRLAHLAQSPEVSYALKTASPEEFVALLKSRTSPRSLKQVAARWAANEGGLDVNAARTWRYVNETAIGTGEFADEVRQALVSGRLRDGTEVGTRAFANRLRDESRLMRYFPGMTEVHGKYGLGLADSARGGAEARSLLTRADDWLLETFYGKAERNWARLPAYRQLAAKNFERLRALGYEEKAAHNIASTMAQRDVAEMFFKIGAHTSGEYMMRNVSPFFPAWREVTSTWLLKLPERLGGGSKALGAAFLTSRGQTLLNGFTAAGIIERGPDGRMRVNIPGLQWLVNLIPLPEGVEWDVSTSFGSLFGILPVPSIDATDWKEQLASVLPGIGGAYGQAVSMAAQGVLDRTEPGWQQDLADLLAPYGVGDIGGNISRLYAGLALQAGMDPVPPWEKWLGTEYRDMMVHSAIDDAMRELVSSGQGQYQPPDPTKFDLTDPKQKREFAKAHREWQDNLLNDAERLAGVKYLVRAGQGMLLPFATRVSTEEQDTITAVWGMLYGEGLPEDVRNELRNPLVESFKTAYPYADWWTIGKSEAISRRGANLELEDQTDLEALFSAGLRRVKSPEDYMKWAAGMTTYSHYRAQRRAVYAQFDNNPIEYLLNGAEARERIAQLDANFQHYLALTDVESRQQDPQARTFSEMLASAQQQWYGKPKDVQAVEARELLRILPTVAEHVEEGTYSDMRRQLFGALDGMREQEFEGPGRTMWDTIGKYYDKVADPYYAKLEKLYSVANGLPDNDPRRAEAYQAIREFTAQQKPRRINGVQFPTPEQVSFFSKNEEEQERFVIDKLTLKPEWLTPFQQEVTGLLPKQPKLRKAAEEFTRLVTETEQEFKRQWPSYNVSGYSDARDRKDAFLANQAEQRGLGDMWRLWNAPPYRQLENAGVASGRGWEAASQYATDTISNLRAADLVSDSSSPRAYGVHRWLFNNLNTLYRSDDQFRGTIDNVAVAIADDPERPLSRQDVFWRVFLDGWGSAPAYLIT